jgi:hypothetical protein
VEDCAHLHRRPKATAGGRNAARGQCPCHSAKRLDPTGLNFSYDGEQVGRVTCRRRLVALNGSFPSLGKFGVTELLAPRLGRLQGITCPLSYHLAFVLRHRRQDMNGELVCVRIIRLVEDAVRAESV